MKIIINNKEIEIYEYKTFLKKLIGLVNQKKTINFGIRLVKCSSIHTFFMKQNIDICITDKDNKILFIKENLKPYKIILPIKNGYYTYELPLNSVKYLKINQKMIQKK